MLVLFYCRKYWCKMADSELVLNDVLCYLKCKFGKIALKPLKSSVLDFFDIEDLCDTKRRLLQDVQLMNLQDLPHIPDRRAGSDQAVRVVDDIVTIVMVWCEKTVS